ncbi:MAG: hypothetical protein AAFN70_02690, partial [Planctomycetota bacterium]
MKNHQQKTEPDRSPKRGGRGQVATAAGAVAAGMCGLAWCATSLFAADPPQGAWVEERVYRPAAPKAESQRPNDERFYREAVRQERMKASPARVNLTPYSGLRSGSLNPFLAIPSRAVDPATQQSVRKYQQAKESKEKEARKTELLDLLNTSFEEMHDQQLAQIQEMATRLDRLRAQHEKRAENKEQIVLRRFFELTQTPDPMAWYPNGSYPSNDPRLSTPSGLAIPANINPALVPVPGAGLNVFRTEIRGPRSGEVFEQRDYPASLPNSPSPPRRNQSPQWQGSRDPIARPARVGQETYGDFGNAQQKNAQQKNARSRSAFDELTRRDYEEAVIRNPAAFRFPERVKSDRAAPASRTPDAAAYDNDGRAWVRNSDAGAASESPARFRLNLES